jgi:DNA-binding NtrC family response regulator
MTEQVRGPCREPLERGARLCGVCRLSTEVDGLRRCQRIVAESPAMRALLVRTARFASSSAPVVITGESGTGKEVLARLLHANGPRAKGPFVPVNVAALPPDLLESELFGHVKGAFTGAGEGKEGLLEAAHGGTLFLDEIGEMPAALQPKLLRALQDGEVRRVGAVKAREVDARIVCATHRDLPDLVARGGFRQDLWYRLKVFGLRVPPLRERREDVLPLFRSFLALEGRGGAAVAPATARALEAWPWPGNVRELLNAARHAVALADDGPILPEHLPEELAGPPPSGARVHLRALADVEREHVLRVLQAVGGHEEAARVLGIGRTTLWRKLRAWGVEA